MVGKAEVVVQRRKRSKEGAREREAERAEEANKYNVAIQGQFALLSLSLRYCLLTSCLRLTYA